MKREKKNFNRVYSFDKLISLEKFIIVLSGFEAFKFFFFDKVNSILFEKTALSFIFSKNFSPNVSDDLPKQLKEIDFSNGIFQAEILTRLFQVIEKS